MAKRNAVVGTTIEGGVVVVQVAGIGEIRVDSETLHPNIQLGAMIRGLKSRLEDAAAIERDRETGRPATPQEKFDAVKRLADHLTTGDTWEVARVGGKRFNIDAVVMGMMRASGIGLETANKRIDGLAAKRGVSREDAARLWAATPEVIRAIAEIAAEKMAPETASGLLAELEGE